MHLRYLGKSLTCYLRRRSGIGWGQKRWGHLGGRLTSAASRLGSCRRSSSGTRLFSTSFRRGPRSPTRSPPWPRRTSVPRSPAAEARTESRACMGDQLSWQNQQRERLRPAVWGRGLGWSKEAMPCWGGAKGGAWGGDCALWGRGLGRGSHHPGVVGDAVPALRSGVAPAPSAAAVSSLAPPALRPRVARRPRPTHPGARAAAQSRVAPAQSGIVGSRPQTPPPVPPGPVPHLPTVQRQVAEAKQAQPTHCRLRVALPSAEPLQDDLLPKEPRSGPAL